MPVGLVFAVAAVPALIVLPFFKDGTERAAKLVEASTSYVRALGPAAAGTPVPQTSAPGCGRLNAR